MGVFGRGKHHPACASAVLKAPSNDGRIQHCRHTAMGLRAGQPNPGDGPAWHVRAYIDGQQQLYNRHGCAGLTTRAGRHVAPSMPPPKVARCFPVLAVNAFRLSR